MEVLILSKTKYGSTQFCVGGICVSTKQFVRLLNPGGYYQPADTRFNVGDIWDISFTVNQNRREPHNEDVTIGACRFVKKVYALETYITNMGVPIWRNSILNIFEGKILWQRNGKGYFSERVKNYPSHSVGFWIADADLKYSNGSYIYEGNGITRQMVYKGSQPPLEVIPRGKLVRLSLAKWWKPDDSDIEERCYLQLSGWYEDQSEPVSRIEDRPAVRAQSANEAYSRYKIEPPKYQAPRTAPQPKNTSGSCYIATLCYGDYYADEVCVYRDFRDATLSKNKIGRLLISGYYHYAPKLVVVLRNYGAANLMIKHAVLNPLLLFIKTFKLDRQR
jgi:hypothetical protein